LSFWDPLEGEVFIKKNEKEWEESKGSTQHECIITRGSRGAGRAMPLIESIEYPTKPIESPDVIGAGDVFLAGLVVNYLRHGGLPHAIEFANMCAGISVEQQGTTEVRLP